MEKSTNKKKNFFSEWLETLQQESWQLELLISGLALFGIWQSKSILHRVDYYFDVHLIRDYSFAANIFMKMLWAGWAIFLINLLIHIIIRGFWIGAIGLRYVSGDVDYEALNYSKRFTDYFKKRHGTFDDYIERLEKISSVLFSFTFLLFFILLSFVMYILVFTLFISIINRVFPGSEDGPSIVSILFILVYFGMGLIVMIDFFTLGAFKKITEKYISGTFYFFYRFYEIVSLSFIYRPLLLNFIDNPYTKRLFFLAIPYSLILLGVQGFSLEKYDFFPSFDKGESYHYEISSSAINWLYYDDLREQHLNTFAHDGDDLLKKKINYISLHHFENKGNYLKFFLEYVEGDNTFLKGDDIDIPAFRKSGLRHTFMKNRVPDSNLVAIALEELHEQEIVRKIVFGTAEIEQQDTALFHLYKDVKKDDLKKVRKKISRKYRLRKEKYQVEKLERIKDNLLDAYSFNLDYEEEPVRMNCDFYIHNNMHERGLLCYIAIDSLDYGGHYLNISKKKYSEDCDNDCYQMEMNLPFRKIK